MPYEPAAQRRRIAAGTSRRLRKIKSTARSGLMLRPLRPVQENLFSTTRRFRLALQFQPNVLVADNGGYQTVYGLTVALSDIPNWAEYTSIFDEYRITGAEVEFQPRITDMPAATDNKLCTLGWFIDNNSVDLAGLSSAENPWLERTGYRQVVHTKTEKVKFTPRPQTMVYQGATSTGYSVSSGSKMNDFIACTNNSVPHYGLYWRIYAPDTAIPLTNDMVNVYVNVSLQFKSTR